MVNSSAMNLLFFLGVLIPALITVALFVIFCVCWYKIRIRNQIRYKKYDPHKIETLKEGQIYEAPPPPPPPFKANAMCFPETYNNNNNKNKPNNDNYEESPEPTEGFDNPAMYRSNPSSSSGGFSDINHIQCSMDNSPKQRHHSEAGRPNSQASDDSDDSGFRSSRSGQYIHSASSSSGGHPADNCQGHSSQMHDSVPLFKPIKIHPNEIGRQPLVSYTNRNSNKHRSFNKQRSQFPTSQHYNSMHESRKNNINTISQLQQPIQLTHTPTTYIGQGQPPTSYRGQSHGDQCYSLEHLSKSNNDVHGGNLHSIDTHSRPLSSVGHIGLTVGNDQCGHMHRNGYYSDGLSSQPNSIGYGSDFNSLGQNDGYNVNTSQYHVNSDPHCNGNIPVSNHVSLHNKLPVTSHIPGYNISHSSQMRPIQPDLCGHKFSGPLQTVSESPMQLTITQAMVHKPYIEDLSDPKLYSVV